MIQVIIEICPKCFSGICSDDTRNTRVAHKKVQKKYPWILNTPDPCHWMNLLVKDICTIPFFQPIIMHEIFVANFANVNTGYQDNAPCYEILQKINACTFSLKNCMHKIQDNSWFGLHWKNMF